MIDNQGIGVGYIGINNVNMGGIDGSFGKKCDVYDGYISVCNETRPAIANTCSGFVVDEDKIFETSNVICIAPLVIPKASKLCLSLFSSLFKNASDYTPRKFETKCVKGVNIPPLEVIEVGTLFGRRSS